MPDQQVTDGPITDDDVRRYVDDGYLVVPGLVDSATVETLRAEIDRFVAGDYPISNADEVADATGVLCVHFPHWVSEPVEAAIHHPGIGAVLGAITAAHLPHWDGRVKCMQSMIFLKPPGFPGQAWHQDERFIATRDRSLVGAWIALDDATEANGCLRVIPGSHRMGQLWPTAPHGRPDEFDPTDEAQGVDETGEVLVEVSAGDVVFFNGYVLHRSMRNRSDHTRRALVLHCMNAWSNLPWHTGLERRVDAATHDHRVVVPVVGEDPYPWKGIEEPPGQVFLRPHRADTGWGTVQGTTDGAAGTPSRAHT